MGGCEEGDAKSLANRGTGVWIGGGVVLLEEKGSTWVVCGTYQGDN